MSKSRVHHTSVLRSERSKENDLHGALPTILVAAEEELRASIVPTLEMEGYLVLEARNEAEALHVVISQTRSIHIFLADMEMDGRHLASLVNPYRPDMEVFFVTARVQIFSDVMSAAAAVAKIRERLQVPNCFRREALASASSGRAVRMIA